MKIINKNTFAIKEITDNQLTTFSKNDFAICNVDFEVSEVEGIETEVLPNALHVKSLVFGEKTGVFDTVVSLELYTEEEQLGIDLATQATLEAIEHKISFKGFRYKVTCDYVLLKTNYNSIYQLAIEENNPRNIEYDENDNPIRILSFWNDIKPTLKSIIEADIETFVLEECPIG